MITIIIPDKPIPQARARVTRWGTFDPIKDKKTWIKFQIREQSNQILNCPLKLQIEFDLPIPKSTPKKTIPYMLLNQIPHTKKPDIDNLCKTYLDCMKGIVYKDDSQIYEIYLLKSYSLSPKTKITIMEQEDD